MKKRGKILRDTNAGPGLLIVEGKQFPFTLEGMWQSERAPHTGMAVEVEFSGDDRICAIVALPEAQLAREQADLALAAARARGAQLASGLVGRVGMQTLLALGALACAWFVLNTVSVQVGPGYNVGLSFWKLLAVLNAPSGVLASLGGGSDSTGMYGVLAIAALVAPLAPYFWRDRRANLGALMPLALMLFVAFSAYSGIRSSVGEAQTAASAFGGVEAARMMAEMQQSMAAQAMRAVSLGAGFYLAIAASLYFAAKGGVRYLADRAS